jgi:hypothetical protein
MKPPVSARGSELPLRSDRRAMCKESHSGRLLNIAALLFAQAFARKRLLGAALLPRLQIVAVALDFLNDIFALYFAFEATEGAFEAFPLLNYDFCQINSPPVAVPILGFQLEKHIEPQQRAGYVPRIQNPGSLCSGTCENKSSNKFFTK